VRAPFRPPLSRALGARIVRSVPLLYADGADAALDRPAHVRSASALVPWGGALVVVQDDALFLALADPRTGRCRPVTLPAGEGGARQFDDVRGNKRHKPDLEAATAVPDGAGGTVLVAFGSGSTPTREAVLLARGLGTPGAEVRLAAVPALHAALRAAEGFSGSALNVEGAAYRGGRVVLVNRGNGAPTGGREPVDAFCTVPWEALRLHLEDPARAPAPAPEAVLPCVLPAVGGCRLTLTDAAWIGRRLLFTAAAEDSPNAVDDGPVTGSAVGWLPAEGEAGGVALLCEADGAPALRKVEGIAAGPRPRTLYLCTDPDAPDAPSELLEVELTGPWPD
jgi:hypothetical protein